MSKLFDALRCLEGQPRHDQFPPNGPKGKILSSLRGPSRLLWFWAMVVAGLLTAAGIAAFLIPARQTDQDHLVRPSHSVAELTEPKQEDTGHTLAVPEKERHRGPDLIKLDSGKKEDGVSRPDDTPLEEQTIDNIVAAVSAETPHEDVCRFSRRQKALLQQAEECRQFGQWKKTADLYRTVWEQTEDSSVANNLAGVLLILDRAGQAEEVLRKALEKDREDKDLQFNHKLAIDRLKRNE